MKRFQKVDRCFYCKRFFVSNGIEFFIVNSTYVLQSFNVTLLPTINAVFDLFLREIGNAKFCVCFVCPWRHSLFQREIGSVVLLQREFTQLQDAYVFSKF